MQFDFRHLEGNEYLIAALVFVAVLSAYMIGLHVWDRYRRRGLPCRWERDKIQPHAGTIRWTCATCGETGYATGRRAPVTCKKALGVRGL
jgi:hypothetical protein